MAKLSPKQIDSEIRQNLLSDSEKAELFLQKNWKKLIVAAILVVAAVGIVSALHSFSVKRSAARYAALVNASNETDLAAAIAVAGSGAEVDAARLRLARMYTDAKKFTAALDLCAKIAAEGDPVFAGEAKMFGAYTLELSNDLKGAAQRFTVLADDPSLSGARRCEAIYAAARLKAVTGDLKGALDLSAQGAKNTEAPYWQNQCRRLSAAVTGGEFGPLK